MPPVATVLSVVLLASPVVAAPPRPIDLGNVPPRCRSVSEVPASAMSAEPGLSAEVSTASCVAQAAVADPTLTDDDESIRRADAAAAPAVARLDDVIAHGDAKAQLVAEYTKGNLLFGLQTRLRESIPRMTAEMSPADVEALERRRELLEAKLAPIGEEGTFAFWRVEEIARANPSVVRENPVTQDMVCRAAQVNAPARPANLPRGLQAYGGATVTSLPRINLVCAAPGADWLAR